MLAKRIIPCLDVKDGQLVKGIQFTNLANLGDPVKYAVKYCDQGADELTFLDISASNENRSTRYDWVQRVAKNVFIPFTVGGGIRSLGDMEQLLNAGADKIAINTAAVLGPSLIKDAATRFGSQFVVLSIDALLKEKWQVTTNGGRTVHPIDPLEWAKKAQDLGAGEILLNVINTDGVQEGFHVDLTQKLSETLQIPVIASGGAGNPEDFFNVLTKGKADAALAASVFHYEKLTVLQVKEYLKKKGVHVRFE